MKEYRVSGELMKGFIGNISYEVVLPVDLDQIAIEVSFEKRMMEDITEEDIKAEFKHGILKLFVPKKEAKPAVEEKKYITIEG